ncbi:MAG: hypothetical protein ACR2RB_05630, partial [Gammaproteobacteria bacterium]
MAESAYTLLSLTGRQLWECVYQRSQGNQSPLQLDHDAAVFVDAFAEVEATEYEFSSAARISQLQRALHTLLHGSTAARHIIKAWNGAEIYDQVMAYQEMVIFFYGPEIMLVATIRWESTTLWG